MSFGVFGTDHILFELWGYKMSLIEFLGTTSGLVSVGLAARTSLWTWPTGIINAVLLFLLFYQLNLYSDMFLQIYFFVVCSYGWWKWRNRTATNDDRNIEWLSRNGKIVWAVATLAGALAAGWIILHLNEWLPKFFPEPAAYPFADSFIAVMSISAMLLMARKKTESWILWLIINVMALIVYSLKHVYFLAGEYVVFLVMATYGFLEWRKASSARA